MSLKLLTNPDSKQIIGFTLTGRVQHCDIKVAAAKRAQTFNDSEHNQLCIAVCRYLKPAIRCAVQFRRRELLLTVPAMPDLATTCQTTFVAPLLAEDMKALSDFFTTPNPKLYKFSLQFRRREV